jgi:hypothetical protein
VVDVLGGEGKVYPFFEMTRTFLVHDAFHPIFHGLDIVERRGLQGFDGLYILRFHLEKAVTEFL